MLQYKRQKLLFFGVTGMIFYENKRDTFYAERRSMFSTQPHLHHHIEVLYIAEGTMKAVVNDTVYHAAAGDVLFIFPNQIHSFEDLSPIRGHILITSPDDYPELVNLFKSNLPSTPLIHPESDEIRRIFSLLSDHMEQELPYCLAILHGYSLALLSLLLPLLDLHPQNTLNLSLAQQVLLYCDEHYTEPLSLEQLSRQFGVSRFYISHVFSDKIRINFNNYIHMLRIHAAKQLLLYEARSVTDIAYAVGYNNIRSFNRRFCAATGFSPSEFRRRKHNGKLYK